MNEFTTEDLLFIQELNSIVKSPEGLKIMTTSPKLIGKFFELHEKYGKQQLFETIEQVKANEFIQKNQAKN